MSKSYRIRTQLGINQNSPVKIPLVLEQNFDTLEILSLAIRPDDVYIRSCANYGVVCGRVFCNKGFGIPNARVSIFVPIEDIDLTNDYISSLYPYTSFEDINDDGYRYNLLPYTQSHSGHVPVGTFPEREDVLTDNLLIQVYEKYYKFTVKTNESGDYMIFGVPSGQQTLFMQVDLSDIGEFSLTPQDLIRMGVATEQSVDGPRFSFSTNYGELPQVVTIQKTVQIEPFFGEFEICNYNIARVDFDLTSEKGIKLEPTAVFMGSLISNDDTQRVGKKVSFLGQTSACSVKRTAGEMCSLTKGPGEIIAIRQTIYNDENGRPILERAVLDNDGKVIDENGVWVLEVPMNLDYVYTDENGQRKLSGNPEIGIPTRGKYRFKIKWQQPPELSEPTKRAYFLVPNVKERGWTDIDSDPLNLSTTIVQIPDSTGSGAAQITAQLPVGDGEFFRIGRTQNIIDLLITDPDGNPYTSQVFRTPGIFTFTFFRDDINAPYIFEFENIPAAKFMLEGSYAFSLDWNDYAVPEEAIKCEDSFYDMSYNKVYTTTQLIDRYQGTRFAWNTLGIKKITDSTCQGNFNTFPTNDVFYRIDFQYLVISFFLTIFKFLAIPILFVLHVFTWLMTTFFGPFFILLEALLAALVISYIAQSVAAFVGTVSYGIAGIPPFNPVVVYNPGNTLLGIAFAAAAIAVTTIGVLLAVYRNRIREAGEKLKNFTLPLVLYTDDGCEKCRCNSSTPMSITPDEGLPGPPPPQGDAQSSYLINSTSIATYDGIPNSSINLLSQLFAGSTEGLLTKRFPLNGLTNVDTTTGEIQQLYQYYTTTALPPSELYNLFNTKSKYFNDVPNFGNGFEDGWNQVKVNWFPEINTSLTDYHFDNIMVLVLDKTTPEYNSGDLIAFQDVTLSGDLNRTVTTGTTIFPPTLTVTYADPNSPLSVTNLTQFYNVPILSSQTSFNTTTSFAADVEYFQVITGMTIGQYESLANPFSNIMSFGVRYLQRFTPPGQESIKNVQFVKIIPNIGVINTGYNTLTNYITDYDNYKLLFLFRGVDAHSPRIPQKVDLSRLFGFGNYSQFFDDPTYVIQGEFKMNYPITGTIKTDRHDDVLDNTSSNLFRPSYAFTYSQNDFIDNGTTNLPSYYSSVDSNTFNTDGTLNWSINNIDGDIFWPNLGNTDSNVGVNIVESTSVSDGQVLSVSSNSNCNGNPTSYIANSMTKVFTQTTPTITTDGSYNLYTQQADNRCQQYRNVLGYQGDEIVDGASFMRSNFAYMGQTANSPLPGVPNYPIFTDGTGASIGDGGTDPFIGNPKFFSFQYYTGMTHSLSNRLNIVFRSDRLPTSTTTQYSGPNSFLLHQNSQFAILKVNEEGQTLNPIIIDTTPQTNNENTQIFTPLPYANVLNSVSDCAAAVPLSCYDVGPNGVPFIKPDCASVYMDPPDDYKYFLQNYGCYNFISKPLRSISQDVKNLVEWNTRLNLNLALCFNVASHNFTNQYINGTLYAYPFQNQRVFDSNNIPSSNYCTDLIYLHSPTNNFYYRSSPYLFDINNMDGGEFIGKKNFRGNSTNTGNNKFLGSPTTIMDLGPKVSFIQEIVYNDDYDGYIVSKVKSSSFQNVTDILNLFILSRLVNTNFNQQLIPTTDNPDEGSDDPTVKALFQNKRWNNNGATQIPGYIDGDYSQMIAINSQFGIQEFSPESYTNQSVYFGPSNQFPVFGLLLTGFTQDRDYLTPRRTIWNPNATVPLPSNQQILDCWFTNIKTNSQEVPFYQWSLNSTNTIIGNQNNNYGTDDLIFFSHKYQTLDRLNPSSRYFQDGQGNASLIPGTQINFDSNGNPTINPPQGQFGKFLVGAPFYFYFGLIRGSSAMDVFIKKYVNTEVDV